VFVEHAVSEVEVAVTRDEDVVIAGIVETRVPLPVVVKPHLEPAGLDGGLDLEARAVVVEGEPAGLDAG